MAPTQRENALPEGMMAGELGARADDGVAVGEGGISLPQRL